VVPRVLDGASANAIIALGRNRLSNEFEDYILLLGGRYARAA